MIPKQLQKDCIRFIKLGQGSWCKRPIEKGWSVEKNYNYRQIMDQHDGNYGVVGGYGNLLIIDFDSEFFQEKCRFLFPETFTVKTGGKGLHHLYYFVDEIFPKFGLKDKAGNTVVDFQCKGAYVVGPNCLHDSNKFYLVENDAEISHITKSFLMRFFNGQWREPIEKPSTRQNPIDTKLTTGRIKKFLSIKDVLQEIGVKKFHGKNYACPLHPISKGNRYNAQYDDCKHVWFCFDEICGGDVFDLWMRWKNCDFLTAKDDLLRIMGD